MEKNQRKIDPSFDGEITQPIKEYLPVQKNRSILGLLNSVLLYSVAFIIFFSAALVFWQIAGREKMLNQSALYLYKMGLLKDKSQIELNAIECWRSQKYNCVKEYIKLIDINKYQSAEILAINGALLSMSGEHKEAANYLNKVSSNVKLDQIIINHLCISNAGAGNNELAANWCNVAIGYEKLKDYRNIEIVKSFADSLLGVKRYAEALALLQEYDFHQISLGNKPYFQSDRIFIETKLNYEPSRKTLTAYKNSVESRFKTVVKLGNMNYGRFSFNIGSNSNIVVSPDYFHSNLVAHKFIRKATGVAYDGSKDNGSLINVKEIHVGGIRFSNVIVYVCERKCHNFLGMGMLNRFNIRTDSIYGEQVMTLELR